MLQHIKGRVKTSLYVLKSHLNSLFIIHKTFIFYSVYSGGKKYVVFCFALLLPQILVNFQNQGQIWKLQVMTFSKHPLHVQFDKVLAEIFKVKDTILLFSW